MLNHQDLLNAIDGYCTPNKKLWGVPIVWPLIVIHGLGDDGDDEREVGKKPRAEESSFPVSSTGSDSKATKMLTLEMGVYFSRLVFFLISCDGETILPYFFSFVAVVATWNDTLHLGCSLIQLLS